MTELAAEPPPAESAAAAAELSLRQALRAGAVRHALPTALAAAAAHPEHLGLQLALAEAAEAAYRPAIQRDALEAAIRLCRRRLALAPRDWTTHELMARLLYRICRFDEAFASYARLQRHHPTPAITLGLVKCGLPLAQWEGLASLAAAAVPPLVAHGYATASNLIALPLPRTAPALLAAGRIESNAIAAGVVPFSQRPVSLVGPLRIGYVSPDFNDHAVAHQVPRVFELHNRQNVTVFTYDIGHDDGSPYRQRLIAASDYHRDCRQLEDNETAALIAADRIDILVDLAGHTIGSRLGIFARRPAPIQVTWLGYPATTGASFIDYLIGDRTVVAPDLRPHFSESIAYLPDCYLPSDDRQAIAPALTRTQAGFPQEAVVLAALHQPYKLEPSIVGAWLHILQRAPKTVLWLRAKEETMQNRLREEPPARIIPPADVDNHLRRKPETGEALARRPPTSTPAGSTANASFSEAHWAGVPVSTPGRRLRRPRRRLNPPRKRPVRPDSRRSHRLRRQGRATRQRPNLPRRIARPRRHCPHRRAVFRLSPLHSPTRSRIPRHVRALPRPATPPRYSPSDPAMTASPSISPPPSSLRPGAPDARRFDDADRIIRRHLAHDPPT
jgi:hypothetical protein